MAHVVPFSTEQPPMFLPLIQHGGSSKDSLKTCIILGISDDLVDTVIHITRVTFAAGVALALGLAITPKLVR